jgi:hypothetical protein
MKQFDYNKYLKNNILLKEDAPPKPPTPPKVSAPPPSGPKNAPPRAATPPKPGTPPKGTPPPPPSSNVGQKTSKFVADNKTFIDKIKATAGTDIKVLAGIMNTIMNKVASEKKIPLSSDAKRAVEYLNAASGQKKVAAPPSPGKPQQEIPKAPPPPPPSVKESFMGPDTDAYEEAQNILDDILSERDWMEIADMTFEDALDTVEAYGHRGPKAQAIANKLVALAQNS